MPLSIEEVEKNKRKEKEEENKIIEFFKKRKKDGETDFFSSKEVSQETGISEKLATDILEDMHSDTLAGQLVEFQDKGQTRKMGLGKVGKKVRGKKIFYYGAKFYPQEKIL